MCWDLNESGAQMRNGPKCVLARYGTLLRMFLIARCYGFYYFCRKFTFWLHIDNNIYYRIIPTFSKQRSNVITLDNLLRIFLINHSWDCFQLRTLAAQLIGSWFCLVYFEQSYLFGKNNVGKLVIVAKAQLPQNNCPGIVHRCHSIEQM